MAENALFLWQRGVRRKNGGHKSFFFSLSLLTTTLPSLLLVRLVSLLDFSFFLEIDMGASFSIPRVLSLLLKRLIEVFVETILPVMVLLFFVGYYSLVARRPVRKNGASDCFFCRIDFF